MATHWAIDLGTSNTTVCVDVGRPTTVLAFDFGGGSLEAAVPHSHGSVVVETGRAGSPSRRWPGSLDSFSSALTFTSDNRLDAHDMVVRHRAGPTNRTT